MRGAKKSRKVEPQPRRGLDARTLQQMMPEITALSSALSSSKRSQAHNPFQFPQHPKASTPPRDLTMAMDSGLVANNDWASQSWMSGLGSEGLLFLGYPFLSELAQRPEYRVISETIADDATRKWIDFEVTGDEPDDQERKRKDPVGEAERLDDPDERKKKVAQRGKTDKVKALKDDQARLEVRDRFYALARDDGLFGRSHLYMNFGDDLDGDPKELITPIGDGRDAKSRGKIARGSFQELKVIEAVWTYPMAYNATNPLKSGWYSPKVWYVMGTQIDGTRLLPFVGRPVPDLLKPAYSFGGLSMSQLAKPYVDIWLRTRQSVADLIHSFSVMVLMTDLETLLQPGAAAGLIARANLFNLLRDNNGLMMVNKETEEFKNVSAALGGLHELQAQSQEHMASVSRIPLVKLTGISPSGLNASSEGEILVYDDTISAYQNRFFRPHLTRVVNFQQLSLWGEIDPEISIKFNPLREATEKERGDIQKADADRHQVYVDMGAFSAEEVRKIAIDDPELPYAGLDPDDVPDLLEEEEAGLEIPGGRPELQTQEEGQQAGKSGGGADAATILPSLGADGRDAELVTLFRGLAFDDAEFDPKQHPHAPAGSSTGGQFVSGGGGGGGSTKATPVPGSFNAAMAKMATLPKADKKKAHLLMHYILGQEHEGGPTAFKDAMVALSKKSPKEKKDFAAALNQALEDGDISDASDYWKWKSDYNLEAKKEGPKPTTFGGPSQWISVIQAAASSGYEKTDSDVDSEDLKYKKGDSVLRVSVKDGGWHLESPGHVPKIGSNAEALQALLSGDKDKWTQLGVENAAPHAKNQPAAAPVEASKPPTAEHAKVLHAVALARPQPTPEERSAIDSYKDGGYVPMNNALRLNGHHTPKTKKLQAWLDKAALPQDVVAYRGISGDHVDALKSMLFKGMVYRDRGFVSASTNEGFAQNWKGGDKSAVVKINMPKGYKAAAIKPHTVGDSEFEIVMQCGGYFKVKSYDHKTRRIEVDAIEGPDEDLGPEKDK